MRGVARRINTRGLWGDQRELGEISQGFRRGVGGAIARGRSRPPIAARSLSSKGGQAAAERERAPLPGARRPITRARADPQAGRRAARPRATAAAGGASHFPRQRNGGGAHAWLALGAWPRLTTKRHTCGRGHDTSNPANANDFGSITEIKPQPKEQKQTITRIIHTSTQHHTTLPYTTPQCTRMHISA